jgi:hypothetical protein
MSLPGFTAQASLNVKRATYRARSIRHRANDSVRPASCDTGCLTECYNDGPDCTELGHIACGPAIASYRRMCRQVCCN